MAPGIWQQDHESKRRDLRRDGQQVRLVGAIPVLQQEGGLPRCHVRAEQERRGGIWANCQALERADGEARSLSEGLHAAMVLF